MRNPVKAVGDYLFNPNPKGWLPLEEPISIDGTVDNDLRYGSLRSELTSSSLASPSFYGLHTYPTGGLIANGGTVSYAQLFATQPWISAVVMRLLSWSIRVPLKAYVKTGEDSRERLRPNAHPLASSLVNPWQRGNQAQLVMSLMGGLCVHGNATMQVESGAADTLRFRPLDWRYMRAVRAIPSEISGWETDQDGAVETLPADQVLHAAWWSPFGPAGSSPLAALGTTVAVEQAAQAYTLAMMKNSARTSLAVTVAPEWLDLERDQRDEVIQQIRQQFTDLYTGDGSGRPFILPAGLDAKPISQTTQEAQLIELRKVAREEVCAVYHVMPQMVGIMEASNYSNMQAAYQASYTDSVGPYLILIEQAINSQIIQGLLGLQDTYVEFDFSGVLKGDRLAEVRAIREAIGTGVLTPNEGRTALNYPKSNDPGADELYLPTNNLQSIGNTVDEPNPSEIPVPVE